MFLANLSRRQYVLILYQKGRPVLRMVFLSSGYASFWMVLDRLGFFNSVRLNMFLGLIGKNQKNTHELG